MQIEIKKEAPVTGERILVYGKGGIGKTSIAACFKDPVFLMSPGETGLLTLKSRGEFPDVPYIDPTGVKDFTEFAGACSMVKASGKFKTLVLDTANGAEAMCREFVCNTEFGGEWGEKGFGAFGRGEAVTAEHWRRFLLQTLDPIRMSGMNIVMLAHARVAPHRLPTGEEWERYQPDMGGKKTWPLTFGWVDHCWFMDYDFAVVKRDGRKVGVGGTERILYTTHCAAFDAKSRSGMPAVVNLGDSPKTSFEALQKAFAATSQGDKK